MSESKFAPTPSVNIKAKKGGYFVGTITQMGKEVKLGPNKDWIYFIYEFAIKDTDLPVTVKKDNGYAETDVEEGAVVSIFANKSLHKTLSAFDTGITVRITNEGQTSLGKKAKDGRDMVRNDYSVKMVKAGGK